MVNRIFVNLQYVFWHPPAAATFYGNITDIFSTIDL